MLLPTLSRLSRYILPSPYQPSLSPSSSLSRWTGSRTIRGSPPFPVQRTPPAAEGGVGRGGSIAAGPKRVLDPVRNGGRGNGIGGIAFLRGAGATTPNPSTLELEMGFRFRLCGTPFSRRPSSVRTKLAEGSFTVGRPGIGASYPGVGAGANNSGESRVRGIACCWQFFPEDRTGKRLLFHTRSRRIQPRPVPGDTHGI